jgi:DNA polymerase III alpha subunit
MDIGEYGTLVIIGLFMKIKSIKYLGKQTTYSPEMAGSQHNYVTENSSAIHRNSHAVSYCLWAQRCLWFKAYYPEEWWASVMGDCHPLKLVRYMGAARNDEVKFGEIDINRITTKPAANAGKNAIDGSDAVALGLISLKNVGDSIADAFADDSLTIEEEKKAPADGYRDIDHFIEHKGKNKTLMERLIKLGSFTRFHPNVRATWMWYVHKYCTGKIVLDGEKTNVTELKQKHRELLLAQDISPTRPDGWTVDSMEQERNRQSDEYRVLYPKKKVIPKRILNWKPKPDESRDNIMALYEDDYSLIEILEFENQFLGYYWHSPCDLYHTNDDTTIEIAKMTGKLEGVITDKFIGMTKKSTKYAKLWITDGSKECVVMIWSQDLDRQDMSILKNDSGIRMLVDYDSDRGSFMLKRGSTISKLWTVKGWEELQDGVLEET